MASNYRPILGYLLRRLPIALALGWLGWWLLTTASGGWGAVPRLLFGMACLIGACIAIAFPVARLLAESSGNLFYGDRHARRPAPMYGIPESKRAKGLYEEAMARLLGTHLLSWQADRQHGAERGNDRLAGETITPLLRLVFHSTTRG